MSLNNPLQYNTLVRLHQSLWNLKIRCARMDDYIYEQRIYIGVFLHCLVCNIVLYSGTLNVVMGTLFCMVGAPAVIMKTVSMTATVETLIIQQLQPYVERQIVMMDSAKLLSDKHMLYKRTAWKETFPELASERMEDRLKTVAAVSLVVKPRKKI